MPQLAHRHRRHRRPGSPSSTTPAPVAAACASSGSPAPTTWHGGSRPGMTTGAAIAAVFEAYAAERRAALGRQDAALRAAPDAAGASSAPRAVRASGPRRARRGPLVPEACPRGVHAHVGASARRPPGSLASGARRSRGAALGHRVGPARYHEVRYEQLVAAPESTIRELCVFAALPFEPRCSTTPAQSTSPRSRTSSASCSTADAGVRELARPRCPPADAAAFESIAGDPPRGARVRALAASDGGEAARAAAAHALVRARLTAWNVTASPSSGRRSGAAAIRGSQPGLRGVAARRRDEPAVQREEVRALGGDSGRVLAEWKPPRDRAVLDAQCVGLLLERREETYGPITTGAPRILPPTEVFQSSSPVVARNARSRPSNPPAKTRPSATAGVVYPRPPTPARPHDVSARGFDREDLPERATE